MEAKSKEPSITRLSYMALYFSVREYDSYMPGAARKSGEYDNLAALQQEPFPPMDAPESPHPARHDNEAVSPCTPREI